jgi:hypothetical protein
MKKEKTIEIKHKRLSNRNSDESNIPGRSTAVNNPKEIPQKVRRATTDYGPSKVTFIRIWIIIIKIKSLVCETAG